MTNDHQVVSRNDTKYGAGSGERLCVGERDSLVEQAQEARLSA